MVHPGAQSDTLLGRIGSLADETRLRLLRLLERHELGVVELCDVLQKPQPTVSRHLKVLGDQGWVRPQRKGTTHIYRMILDELDPGARKLWVVTREQTEKWTAIRQDSLRLERLLRDRQVDGPTFFAGAAGEWDRLRLEWYGRQFNAAALLALLPADYVVADLGCGTGNLAAELSPAVRQVIGVDGSSAMLKAARKRTAGMENVDLRRGDLSALPIESNVCDAALLVLALSYVSETGTVLNELTRILKPGGRAVIVDLLPHHRDDFRRNTGQTVCGLDPIDIARRMTSAGLNGIAHRSLPPESTATGPALFLASGVSSISKKEND